MPFGLSLRRSGIACGLGIALALSGCMRSPEVKSAKYIEAGKRLLQKNEAARAILEFQNAVQVTPRNPEAFYQLGLAYLAAGDAKRGVAGLRRALELNPKHAAAQLRLAQLMASVSDPGVLKDAQQRLQSLLQDSPADPDALHALALTELKLGEPEDAITHLSQALVAAPQELAIAVTLAQAKVQQKDSKGAEEVLKKACANSPKSADAVVVLGTFYAAQNRGAEAAQQFERALAMDPNNAAALSDLAIVQNQMGRKQDAEQNFKRLAGFPDRRFNPSYAIFLFEEGRRDEAIREFERLAKADPEDRLARTRLVAVYRAANRGADAEKLLDQALKKNPKDLDALLQRGEMFLAAGKYGEAEADLNQVLHMQPDSAEARYILAKLHQARGEDLSYRQDLAKALELGPYLLPVRLELAQALTANNGAATALDILDKVPESQKRQISVLVQRNWALWALGDLAEMRKQIDHGLAQQRSPDLLIQDGLWKLRAGDSSGARAALEEALKIDPADLRALKALGQTYIAQKNAPMALQKVKEYAARQPKSAPVQDFLGELLAAEGQRTEARTVFVAAKAADPHFEKADLSLVQLDVADGKIDDARKRLQTLLATDGNNSTGNLWLGILEEIKGDDKTAIEQYRKVVGANPASAQASNNLAYLLIEQGQQLDEALKYAQSAVEAAPERPAYSDTLGWALYKKGLYVPAVQYLRKAGSDSKDVVWKYHLAMAYAKAGDQAHAQATLNAALKLNPNVPEAKMARQVVEESH